MKKHYKEIKKAIRRSNIADLFTCSLYHISPYMACAHGCAYCDGRAEKYWVKGDFENDIIVRNNLPEVFGKELGKQREIANICISSGVSDCYQPAERDEKLTRQCGEAILDAGFPATVMTKSALIMRDLDIWEEVNKKNRFLLMVSLTTLDDDIRAIFEPAASLVKERLKAVREFKRAGCAVGVLAIPLLPGLTDTKENFEGLVSELNGMDVDFVMPGGLTLRPGRQKAFFINRLKKHFPALVDQYESIYRENRQSGNTTYGYRRRLSSTLYPILDRYGMPFSVPHRIYRKLLPPYQAVAVLFAQMKEVYDRRGIDTDRLVKSSKRYGDWLLDRKRYFSRRRNLPSEWQDNKLQLLLGTDDFEDLIDNPKLSRFLREVLRDGKVFNQVTARLDAS